MKGSGSRNIFHRNEGVLRGISSTYMKGSGAQTCSGLPSRNNYNMKGSGAQTCSGLPNRNIFYLYEGVRSSDLPVQAFPAGISSTYIKGSGAQTCSGLPSKNIFYLYEGVRTTDDCCEQEAPCEGTLAANSQLRVADNSHLTKQASILRSPLLFDSTNVLKRISP